MKTALIAIALTAGLAHAGVQVYTDSVTGTFQPLDTLDVPQYNGPISDIDTIIIDITASVDLAHFSENTSPNGMGAWNFTTDYAVDIADHTGASALAFADSFTTSGVHAVFDGTLDFAGTSGVRLTTTDAGHAVSIVLTAGVDDLSAFVGAGSVVFDIVAEAFATLSRSGSGAGGVSTILSADLRVSYIGANIVPAPGSLALLGAGVLAAARRRR